MASAGRISLLSDQLLFTDSLSRLLDAVGFTVSSTHQEPHGFLQALGPEQIDVAIIDFTGDPNDGMTIVEEAHQLHSGVRVLVLFTGLDTELMERCFRAGASGYLDKSIARFDALVDAIQAVMKGNNVFPAQAVEALLRAPSLSSGRSDGLHGLSEREREVLAYLSVGADNLQIASTLKISERTVKAHVSSLYRKLGQDNRTQLALLARQSGIRPPPPMALLPRAELTVRPSRA